MIVAAPDQRRPDVVIVYWPQAAFHASAPTSRATSCEPSTLAPGARRAGARRQARRALLRHRRPAELLPQAYGPGWALVGDAGYHKDPITAQGIRDAFRDAELLADASTRAGRRPRRRAGRLRASAATSPPGRATRSRPVRRAERAAARDAGTLRALRDDQAQTDRFFGDVRGHGRARRSCSARAGAAAGP